MMRPKKSAGATTKVVRLLAILLVALVFCVVVFSGGAKKDYNSLASLLAANNDNHLDPKAHPGKDDEGIVVIKKKKTSHEDAFGGHEELTREDAGEPQGAGKNQAAVKKDLEGDPTKVIDLTMTMSEEMKAAWKKSSERLTFPVQVSGLGQSDPDNKMSGKATFYGKSSLKLKYTKRRSLHVVLDEPIRITPDAPLLNNFVLLSLWEDSFRIAYRSSATVLKQLGLFFPFNRLVEFRCEEGNELCSHGGTLGAYLLIEYPSDAIVRHTGEEVSRATAGTLSKRVCEPQSLYSLRKNALSAIDGDGPVAVGTRNWFYFEKPAIYDLLHVPSYKRNSTLSPLYRKIETNPENFLSSNSEAVFDMNSYMTWLAINTLLQNGDYDDEVFFYGSKAFLGIMAWDYDSVLSPCHRNGKNAVRSTIMFCGETPLEKKILKSDPLQAKYVEALNCVMDHLQSGWGNAVERSRLELESILNRDPAVKKATFDDSKKCCPLIGPGAKKLIADVEERISVVGNSMPGVHRVHRKKGGGSTEGKKKNKKGAKKSHGHEDSSSQSSSDSENQPPHEQQQHNAANVAPNDDSEKGHSRASSGGRCHDAGAIEKVNKELNAMVEFEYKKEATPLINRLGHVKFGISDFSLSTPNGKILNDFTTKQWTHTDPGLYCLSFVAQLMQKDGSDCKVHVERPFVVRSRERGKAEFAVTHFEKPNIHKFFTAAPAITLGPSRLHVTVIVPPRWQKTDPFLNVFPIVTRLTDEKGQWVRKNVMATFDKNSKDKVPIVRGFSAAWIGHRMPLLSQKDKGEKAEHESHVDEAGPYFIRHVTLEDVHHFSVSVPTKEGPTEQKRIPLPRELDDTENYEAVIPHRISEGTTHVVKASDESKADTQGVDCVVKVGNALQVLDTASLVIKAGCVVLMEPEASFEILGSVSFQGTKERPIMIIPTGSHTFSTKQPGFVGPIRRWKTLFLKGREATLNMKYTFVMGSGTKDTDPRTGHHHKRSAAITAVDHATVNVKDSFFLDLSGPAFAAGVEGSVKVEDSLVQWAEMGVECLSCTFTSIGTVWTHFPSWTSSYIDEDNDGLYLSGGRHRVLNSVIAHTKDDGIDSGTPEKGHEPDGGSLLVDRTIIEMVAHEGIALSSSPHATRHCKITNSVVRHSQQGIENGYTGRGHDASIEKVLIGDSNVGVRFGDNYRKDIRGKMEVKETTLFDNRVDVLNYVRNKKGAGDAGLFKISDSKLFSMSGFNAPTTCQSLYPTSENGKESVVKHWSDQDALKMEETLLGEYSFSGATPQE